VNIEELVNGSVVESTRIEFKASFNPEPIIHTICAFANDIDNIGGGYIIVGIEERDSVPQLPPLGVERSKVDGILKKLQGFCHCIEPLYEPIVEPMLFQDRYVIVIWCPGGYGRPYKAARNVYKNTADKRYYIRKMASTVVASAEEERELFYASSDIPFDDRPNLTARVDDLSLALMRDYLREVGSALYAQSSTSDVNDLATDLQLVAGPPEDLRPRNVGLLMFCDHVERFFRYARIEVVDLPDPTGEGMTEQVFTGPIQRQLRDALLYLKNYEIRSRTVKDPNVAEANYGLQLPIRRGWRKCSPTPFTIAPTKYRNQLW
jgi:ATP-dependent DNA helicase RecG